MQTEIAKIQTKADYQNNQAGMSVTAAAVQEIKQECEKLKREYTASPTKMIGVDPGPLAEGLSKRIAGAFQIKAVVDARTGL